MEEPRADAGESSNDPLDRLAKRLLDPSLDDVDLEEPSAPSIEGTGSPLPPALLRLRDYTVMRCLGRGGMGAVYLAHQRSLPDKQVALKVLPDIYATDPERLARFRNEASTASRLNHPGIVAVLDIGHENGVHFQVQELVEDGWTLGDLIREARDARTLPKDWYRTTAELFAKIAEALAAVHAANVLHRDIKPSNILLTPLGEPKVGDFGLAKDLEGVNLTNSGSPGTLNYKSPEHFTKALGKIDERSDVFSLGVTMYEALMLTRLFPGDDPREVQPAIMDREVEDLRKVRPGVPKDLSTLCRKCLEKQPGRRYQAMTEVAEDLRRYLRNEPIRAQEPSRWDRTWKWSRRNPGVAAGIGVGAVALVVISVVALVAVQLADEKDQLATKEARARETVEGTSKELAATVRDFRQLAGVERLKAVLAREKQLWPAWPDKVEALEHWLREDCAKLLEMEPEIRRTVDDLRRGALSLTPEQIEVDRRSHPRFGEFELLQKHVASLRYAQAIRLGRPLIVPELLPWQQEMECNALRVFAELRIHPIPKYRTVWGEEALGLAAAREAVAKRGNDVDGGKYLDTLAYALLANGQDSEAMATIALADALDKDPEARTAGQRYLRAAIDESKGILTKAEAALVDFTLQIGERRTWLFAPTQVGEGARFLHDTLAELLGKLGSLASKEKADVDMRLLWAKQIQDLSLHHPNARHKWPDVRTAIASNNKYAGRNIDLRDQDITGLVPIGENPVTHLWEFYELRSAWDGKTDPREIAIPAHDPKGSIDVTGDTGIVFVLLPGGMVTLGCQENSPDAPYFDTRHDGDEQLHKVSLSPFFFARHEMTTAQWSRLMTWDADMIAPSTYKSGMEIEDISGRKITQANPVEQVDWATCDTLLTRHGMVLPSEAQWEYACRGGTTTPWNTELDDLRKVANLADDDAKRAPPNLVCEAWADGHAVHAPVGSFRANAFGLYDVHGNVSEWCRDHYSDHGRERSGDGMRSDSEDRSALRSVRGGSFRNLAKDARSSKRSCAAPSLRIYFLGLRPARQITP